MTVYFHAATVQLRPGSVIDPGNYGRMLRFYRNDGSNQGWKLATEMAFEAHRASSFPALPSRLDACFAFVDLASAIAGKPRLGGDWNLLYEVEMADEGASTHIGDFDLISRCYASNPHDGFMQTVQDAAQSYWRGRPGIAIRELLTSSGLRVIRRIGWPPTPVTH